jgi:hypothetical protein
LRSGPQEDRKSIVRFSNDAELVRDEIRDGRVLEQVVITLSLADELLMGANQLVVLAPQLFFGHGELFVRAEELIGAGTVGWLALLGRHRRVQRCESLATLGHLVLPKSERKRQARIWRCTEDSRALGPRTRIGGHGIAEEANAVI